jgi:hypothetical protein
MLIGCKCTQFYKKLDCDAKVNYPTLQPLPKISGRKILYIKHIFITFLEVMKKLNHDYWLILKKYIVNLKNLWYPLH